MSVEASGPYGRLYENVPDLWGARPGRLMSRVVSMGPIESALDLGCGEGRNALYLAERGVDVWAIDIDGNAISRLLSRVTNAGMGERIRSDCADFSIVGCGSKADLVLAYGLLHCLNDMQLENLWRIAQRQGPKSLFAGSALTSELPIPSGHGTGELHLRSRNFYRDVLTRRFDLVHWEVGVIKESHYPVADEHTHASVWFIGKPK